MKHLSSKMATYYIGRVSSLRRYFEKARLTATNSSNFYGNSEKSNHKLNH